MSYRKIIVSALAFLFILTASGQKEFNIREYGAKGDGLSDDAMAIQKAIDTCSVSGGGKIIIPSPFTFLTGPFNLKSGIVLFVEKGAVIKANPDKTVYTKSAFRENKAEGTIWIGGENIKNVSIEGGGFIDGNGISFMGKEQDDSYELLPVYNVDPRPHVLTIVNGENIRIHDLSIGNSAYWNIHLAGCRNVDISGIIIPNNVKIRNSDGIDLDHCKHVRISNCHIESGDDCICFKNRREYEEFGSCEDIIVNNCLLTSRSCAIKIGSENTDTVRNILVKNCKIINSNRGIGIQNRDEGVVLDVIFSNISIQSHLFSDVWWGKSEPIYVTAYKRATGNSKDANWRFPPGATEGLVGVIRNITFRNIKCVAENGVYVSAESQTKIDNIIFDHVNVFINKTTSLKGGVYDRRPCEAEGFVKSNTAGFYFDTVQKITLNNCSVKWGKNVPSYFGTALKTTNVAQTKTTKFAGKSAFPGKVPVIIK